MHYVVMLVTHRYGTIADKIFNRLSISDVIVGGELIYECNYILYAFRNVHTLAKLNIFYNIVLQSYCKFLEIGVDHMLRDYLLDGGGYFVQHTLLDEGTADFFVLTSLAGEIQVPPALVDSFPELPSLRSLSPVEDPSEEGFVDYEEIVLTGDLPFPARFLMHLRFILLLFWVAINMIIKSLITVVE